MLSNFIKHYNDFEKNGTVINLNKVKRVYKRLNMEGPAIVFLFTKEEYTVFTFEDEFTRDNYHNQLVQLLTLEIII